MQMVLVWCEISDASRDMNANSKEAAGSSWRQAADGPVEPERPVGPTARERGKAIGRSRDFTDRLVKKRETV